jgi:hypothetical protein
MKLFEECSFINATMKEIKFKQSKQFCHFSLPAEGEKNST